MSRRRPKLEEDHSGLCRRGMQACLYSKSCNAAIENICTLSRDMNVAASCGGARCNLVNIVARALGTLCRFAICDCAYAICRCQYCTNLI